MEKRMDASNISINELAKKFVDYINTSSVDTLKSTYKNDVVEDEDGDIVVGKFRLFHLFETNNDNEEEYLTFTACFSKNEDESQTLVVHNIEKNEIILECTFNPSLHSWILNNQFQEITRSSITDMAQKLKSILDLD